ncbi:hypothetical protein ACFL27_20755 [candidate division CSSED10-310 bacterium]|uniref:Uncharacterized protein n=1 Tax=candidate division CSSED10-310 bacterium TaxID=2855610 RepID=A0ABV6Z2F6_UNCC1
MKILKNIADEYRALAEIWQSIDYSNPKSVQKCNAVTDKMRNIVRNAELQGIEEVNKLIPLLNDQNAKDWIAHHLVELTSIEREISDKCFEMVKNLIKRYEIEGKTADAMGERLWLEEWTNKK